MVAVEKKIALGIDDLKVWFDIEKSLFGKPGKYVKALDGVSFSIRKGEIFGLVGESGCGKTTLSRAIVGLNKISSGTIRFFEKEEISCDKRCTLAQFPEIRKQVQMVFQDPFSSLNPRMKIGETISEPLEIQRMGSKKGRQERVKELLEVVGLEGDHYYRYPHEFSGGQRQRVGIARALASNPTFIICDEPVSALDVSIRSQILNLLTDLRDDFELTMLFVSHDLSVVEYLCDRIAVMYLGKIVELSLKEDLYCSPLHPYTEALLSAIPIPDPKSNKQRIILKGDAPDPANPPKGCKFSNRCPRAQDICSQSEPHLIDKSDGHLVACHFPNRIH